MAGGIAWTERSAGSFGGTQVMARGLERRLPADLLARFQIHLTRAAEADPRKIQILWCHICADGPECAELANGGWGKFDRIVFVSNWQAQSFIHRFGIPWSRCVVLQNAIEPIAVRPGKFRPIAPDRPIRLVYTSVPDRGLVILYHVFKQISEERDDVELKVFSSFRLYGWPDGDYEKLFEALRRIPRVTYYGAVPNQQLRSELARSHVFAYPATSYETSCLCLIEAMSAGLVCVHPNCGALYETAANWTVMYQWQDDPDAHAASLYDALTTVIDALRAGDARLLPMLAAQKAYADMFYNWDLRAAQWNAFLRSMILEPERQRSIMKA
jgi:UDP-glucose:(glucosyl)LPS alpha-1,2-glucosyltransferase